MTRAARKPSPAMRAAREPSPTRAPRRRRSRGAAAIEMALILIPFCLLTFGVIDYGYWFMVDLAATNAVREGARTATTFAGACPNATAVTAGTTAITNYMSTVGLGSLSSSVRSSCATVSGSPQFNFTLTLNFQQLTGFQLIPMPAAGAGFGSGYTSVTASATMRGSN